MVNLMELEYRVDARRDEVEEVIRHEATIRQLRSGEREVAGSNPRGGLKSRLGQLLINLGTRLAAGYAR